MSIAPPPILVLLMSKHKYRVNCTVLKMSIHNKQQPKYHCNAREPSFHKNALYSPLIKSVVYVNKHYVHCEIDVMESDSHKLVILAQLLLHYEHSDGRQTLTNEKECTC